MTDSEVAPEPTIYRLSLYHCFLGELVREGRADITSRELAASLELREETVRRDISFVGSVGRPGAGYQVGQLHEAIQSFLGLSDRYPVIWVGSAEMLRALETLFPADAWGVEPVGFFSEHLEDVGSTVAGIPVLHISEIPDLDPSLGVTVALVACSPDHVQTVVDLCARGGLEGLLLLTPALGLVRPEGMNVSQIRMPCDIKSLACHCGPGGAR